ncbi:MAG: orotate phosphoribosyltransferase [Thermoproteota archaeon]
MTRIFSYPGVFKRVASDLMRIVSRKVGLESFSLVAGVPLAGIPYASYISLKTGKPVLLVRAEGKDRSVEGLLKMGDKVLVVDDFIVTGRQILKITDKIVSEGGVVEQAAVIVCQSREAEEKLRRSNIKLHYLIDFKNLVESLRELGALSDEEYEALSSRV